MHAGGTVMAEVAREAPFALLPSASPYARVVSPATLRDNETMIRLAEAW